ncbi:L-threonylcarbamoyladenylate synthase [Parafilimonas sp.]|uniref:L-threonylcarbamoyladenylate synthase n=1 Tax=Parafilimonas sp. TaxID=1969739 RepID=UPI003F80C45A
MNETDFEQDIINALEQLKKGGTILYPTDTIWGIGCDATNNEAVSKIIRLKQRPQLKSFVVLVASEKDVLQYTASPDLAVFDYLQTVQKPTTVIYEHALGLAENVCNADGSVAIRICSDEFCRHLIKRFRKPIVSTSANVSGEPSPGNFVQVSPVIKKGVDYIVQYRQDDNAEHAASSLIRWKKNKVEIIRP